MDKQVTLIIDDQTVSVEVGTTLLKAAQKIGIVIPTLCYHDYCSANALCRICVVEVESTRALVPACFARASAGMKVHTHSSRILTARRTILEMLAASVDLSEAPDILALMQEYGVDINRFPEAVQRKPEIIDDNAMYIRDYARCVLCWRCVQVCAQDAQYTYAINFGGRGFHSRIDTFYSISMTDTTCVFCGQCVGVCPTGALKPKRQWLLEKGIDPQAIMTLTRTERRQKTKTGQKGL
jgi:NADP-reducing hydrogenase subunit HndD